MCLHFGLFFLWFLVVEIIRRNDCFLFGFLFHCLMLGIIEKNRSIDWIFVDQPKKKSKQESHLCVNTEEFLWFNNILVVVIGFSFFTTIIITTNTLVSLRVICCCCWCFASILPGKCINCFKFVCSNIFPVQITDSPVREEERKDKRPA